jgi:hypothetical protein
LGTAIASESCYEAAGALFAAERAMRERVRAPSDDRLASPAKERPVF